MKQIIPFTKDITFKSKIGELTSISLDHDLILKGEDLIVGNFYIKGNYKMLPTSEIETEYSYKIPVEIAISDEYDTFDATIDIDDFTYEIKDAMTLQVNISVEIDHLEKKIMPVKEEVLYRLSDLEEEIKLKKQEKKEELVSQNRSDDNFYEEQGEELAKELIRKKEENLELELEINKKKELARELEEELKSLKEERNMEEINAIDAIEKSHKEVFESASETYQTYSVYVVKEDDSLEKILDSYQVKEEDLREYNDFNEIVSGMKLIIPSCKNV